MTATWEWFVAAAFGPVAIWVLWRLQVLGVELLRRRLVQLSLHAEGLYTLVSWFGTLLHEVSHAVVLLLSGHGIAAMRVGSTSGHVTPRRVRSGPVGFLSFLAAAMAPLYIPPALVLGALVFWVDPGLVAWQTGGPGLATALAVLRDLAVVLPQNLLVAVAGLDLVQPAHLLVFLLVLLSAPGSRPSHVKGSRFHGRDDEGDVAVVRRFIRRDPWIFVLFLLFLYGLYLAFVPWLPQAYWWPVQAVWAVALVGIVLALFGAVWWTLADWNSRTVPAVAWLPPLLLVAGQVLPRVLGWDVPVAAVNGVSVVAWGATAFAAHRFWPR